MGIDPPDRWGALLAPAVSGHPGLGGLCRPAAGQALPAQTADRIHGHLGRPARPRLSPGAIADHLGVGVVLLERSSSSADLREEVAGLEL